MSIVNVKTEKRTKSNMINLNSDLISVPQTLSGAAAAGVAKVTKDISEQVDESPTYFGAATLQSIIFQFHAVVDIIAKYSIAMVPAEAVDVEVESKVEQLEVVGNSSENLRKDCEYQLLSKISFETFKLHFYN